jgi:putative MFS transporter
MERLPVTRVQRVLFAAVATAWLFDAMDIGVMSFVLGSVRAYWHLNTAQAGLLGSASFVGMFIGAALAGVFADRWGRRPVLQWSMVVWGAASFLCAAATSFHALIVWRVVLGVGMAMELPAAQTIVAEFMPASKRGRYVALLEGLWPIGFVLSGVLAWWVLPRWGWRGAFAGLGVPAVFLLVVRRVVPESPRWLESKGRVEEAGAVMSALEAKVARAFGKALPEVVNAGVVVEPCGPGAIQTLWRGRYARRTAMLWLLWFFALLGFYGLTTWLSALLQQAGFGVASSVEYTLLISLAGIPGFLSAAWLVEAWGRKPTCVLTMVGSAAMAYMYGRAVGHGGRPAEFIPFGLAMEFFMFGMWSVLYAYTPELYPTRCRGTGVGFASSVGRVGSLIGPAVLGAILPVVGQAGVFAMGAGCFVVAAAVVWAMGVETKGRRLEELSP